MQNIESYKGIAPSIIIAYQLKERNLTQRQLAERVSCHAQTISAIINSERDIPKELSFKLDKELGFETGFFLLAQTYYKIKQYKENSNSRDRRPIPTIRRVVFWDIDPKSLNWQTNKEFILKRIKEKGNEKEMQEVLSYYGNQ